MVAAAVTRDSPRISQAVIQDAGRELQALRPRVPKLVINVGGATPAEVTMDGTRIAPGSLGVPRPADPGRHVLRARAPGFAPAEATVTLAEGTARPRLALALAPGEEALRLPWRRRRQRQEARRRCIPPLDNLRNLRTLRRSVHLDNATGSSRSSPEVLGWLDFALGGVFGAQAISSNNSSKADCLQASPKPIYPPGLTLRSNAQSQATVSTAAFVAGGVLAAGGVVLWLTAPSSKVAGTGQIEILPAALGADIGVGLRGRW